MSNRPISSKMIVELAGLVPLRACFSKAPESHVMRLCQVNGEFLI